jgi:hypothetical protein
MEKFNHSSSINLDDAHAMNHMENIDHRSYNKS